MRARLRRYADRIRDGLRESFSDAYTPREVAGSFAVGVFITMLPTLGVGLVLFVVLSALIARINKVALFASVLVFNPPVKWGVYGASITLGVFLLGPVDGIAISEFSLDSGGDILLRLLVGNLVLAVVATLISYVVVYRMVVSYRRREITLIDTTVKTFTGESDSDDSASTDHPTTTDDSTTPADE